VIQASKKCNEKSYSNYGLTDCQVSTPLHVVKGVWNIVQRHRPTVGKVVDLGAGDGRFALHGNYDSYLGVEIDPWCKRHSNLPKTAQIVNGCAFELSKSLFDLCVGNPPYVRYHAVNKMWLEEIRGSLKNSIGVSLSLQANLYVYFLCLGIQKTKTDGIIAMVVPFEWVSRPSAKGLRDLIISNRWNVYSYRLVDEVFEGVLTTASVVIIDKAQKEGLWNYFDVDAE
jgi:hypothetical protein